MGLFVTKKTAYEMRMSDCSSEVSLPIFVELVDLILSVDHRHIPTEQVDEEAFAISEHGLKQGLAAWRQMVVDNVDLGVLPCRGSHARGEQRSCGPDRPGIYSG